MKITKKLISLLIAFVLIITSVPFASLSALAAETENAIVTIDSVSGKPGDTVDVNVMIKNNPGIFGAIITLTYDDELTLEKAVSGEAFESLSFSKSKNLTSPCKFSWDASDLMPEDIKDGTILTLSFKIDDNASPGEKSVNISYEDGDIIDYDFNLIDFEITNGSVTVMNYIPGDVNGDGKVNVTDIVLIRRHITGGYGVSINTDAADVNADGRINTTDLVLIRRYIVGGYGIDFNPHNHKIENEERKEPTCTEDGNIAYWHCTTCGKYFSDSKYVNAIQPEDTVIKATGHTVVTDSAVAPTYTNSGLTEGSHCSVCNAILKAQEVIPKLEKSEYSITYYIDNNDNYLKQQLIDNKNPNSYATRDGLVLQDLVVDGYNFKGWYTKQIGGEVVTEIPEGSKGDKVLYAQWEKVEYTIDFDSPDAPVPSSTYTVDRGITLTNPSWFGYTFVGWSTDGKIVSAIEPGTTGNLVLHANWTSNRNKARAVDKLADPNIIEDADNGRYLFIYEIGTIENVPLSEDGGEQINSEGITITKELAMSKAVQEGTANKIAKTVAKATTETSSWTLSENWNSSTSATNEHDEQIGKTESRTDSEGKVVAGKYYVSNSQGGSTSVSSSVGGSNTNSSKVTAGASVGINGEYSRKTTDGTSVNTTTTKTKEKEFNWNLGGSYGQSNGAKLGMDFGKGLSGELSSGSNWGINGGIGGSNKNTNTRTTSKTTTLEDENAYKISNSRNFNVGTERSSTSEGHWDTSSSSSSNWNSTSGYESSQQTSKNSTVSNAISQVVNDKYSYTSTDSRGGNNSSTSSTADTSSSSDEYASTVEYSTEEITSEKKTLQFKSSATGYYRVITAGTVHVFAVVGYDIATNSYYTYTYNVLDNERHSYLDYSKDNSRFNDCENGIIPFEIPYDVHEYISVKIGRSEGLRINEQTGMITSFTGNAEYVVIPEYISVTDGLNKSKAVRVTGINENAFKGNSSIKAVLLPKHIREIPNNAFEGCSSLETVIGTGIMKIGSEAFKNCTSLKTFIIDEFVESLGTRAFENTTEVYVNARNTQVAEAALTSGANHLILNLSDKQENPGDPEKKLKVPFDDKRIVIPDSTKFFGLISDGKSYKNLSIESNADETFLSNFKLVENTDTPLKLNSETVTLSRVIVEQSPGFSMILANPNTNLKLYGNIELSSKQENAIISKNVNLSLLNNEVDGTMTLTGNWLINGDIANEQNLNINYIRGNLIHITEEEFNNYLTSSKVTFDANGGETTLSNKAVYYGQSYGELPTPVRANYIFDGWFTLKDGGTQVTSDTIVSALVNQTLYAHWTPKTFTVTFNANGGTVSETTRTIVYGSILGNLPTPKKDYYDFDGWFTSPNGNEKVTPFTVFTSNEDTTYYAHWKIHPTSDWVLASNVPSGAKIVDQKWTYDLTTTKTSSNKSEPGYTLYNTTSAWGSYGSWSSWSDTKYTASDSRQVESRKVETSRTTWYHYYRYAQKREGGYGSYEKSSSYPNYYTYDFTSPLPEYESGKFKYWYSSSNWNTLYKCSPYTTTDIKYKTQYRYRDRSKVYTYYHKKVEQKESKTEVTASSTISNVKKYVKYIAK